MHLALLMYYYIIMQLLGMTWRLFFLTVYFSLPFGDLLSARGSSSMVLNPGCTSDSPEKFYKIIQPHPTNLEMLLIQYI